LKVPTSSSRKLQHEFLAEDDEVSTEDAQEAARSRRDSPDSTQPELPSEKVRQTSAKDP